MNVSDFSIKVCGIWNWENLFGGNLCVLVGGDLINWRRWEYFGLFLFVYVFLGKVSLFGGE